MHSSPDTPHLDRDAALLFEEFVRASEGGQAPDVEAWCARAGPAHDALRRRIDLFRTLEALGDTLRPDPGTHGLAGDGTHHAAPRTPEVDGRAPSVLVAGRFENLVPIGQGGSARVYRAYDRELERLIALKLISPLHLVDRTEREWMLQEGRSLARLDHPGVVRVYDVGEADGFAYIAMEWIEGPTLHAVMEALRAIARGEPATDATAAAHAGARLLSTRAARARLFLDLARAVQYCHERGVLHRDLKPGNVILQPDGAVKLIDFGLAHVATAGEASTLVTERLMGTAPYIAPEQLERGRTGADPLSDQFSLSVLLYELFTLVNPFHKATRSATCDAITRADPPPLATFDASIPDDLDRIVRHGLERTPGARYASVKDLADDVQAWLEHRAISLAPPTPWRVALLWMQRRRKEIALVATVGIAVLAVLCAAWGYRVARARSAVWHALRDFDERIPKLSVPQEFLLAFLQCEAVEKDAHELDQILARSLLRDLEPEAHARTVACSLQLSKVLAARRAALSRTNPVQERETTRDLMIEWGSVLTLEENYCRECAYNAVDRQRGRVDVPPIDTGCELRLFTYLPAQAPGLSALQRMQTVSTLGPGVYRCQVVRPGGALDLECDVRAYVEEERTTWRWHRLDESLAERMFPMDATEVDIEGAGRVRVPACRVLRRPVTWSDLQRVFGGEKAGAIRAQFEHSIDRPARDDEPVTMLVDEIREFASLVGARLPTAAEFLAAQRSPEFERPRDLALFTRELVAGPIVAGQIVTLDYDIGAPGSGRARLRARSTLERDTFGKLAAGHYTFRLAISEFPTLDSATEEERNGQSHPSGPQDSGK